MVKISVNSRLNEIIDELNRTSLGEDPYHADKGSRTRARGGNGDDKIEKKAGDADSDKRMANILYYLDMVGVGSDYVKTRSRIKKRVFEIMESETKKEKGAGKGGDRKVILNKKEALHWRGRDTKDPSESSFRGGEYFTLYEDKKKKIGIYYYSPIKKRGEAKEGFYVYTSSGISVQRTSQSELGQGVLGVAYIGLNVIKILDTLYGQDFEEVKKHEILHHQFPHEPEYAIRRMTKGSLPYETKYQ